MGFFQKIFRRKSSKRNKDDGFFLEGIGSEANIVKKSTSKKKKKVPVIRNESEGVEERRKSSLSPRVMVKKERKIGKSKQLKIITMHIPLHSHILFNDDGRRQEF